VHGVHGVEQNPNPVHGVEQNPKPNPNVKYIITNSVKNVGAYMQYELYPPHFPPTDIHSPVNFHRLTRIVSVLGRWSERRGAKQPIVYCCHSELINIWPISAAEFYGLGALKQPRLAENIAPAADSRLKNGLCSAVNQRDDGELHERDAASTEFSEIRIYLPVCKNDKGRENPG